MAPATAPDLARDLGLSPAVAAGAIITAFHALALLIEAPLLAWADRGRVRVVSAAALAVVAAVTLLAAVAPGPLTLFAALALYGPASGCALAASEGVLVEARPRERERTMTRLTLAGVAGDLAVPALLALLAAFGLGWRAAMGVTAAAALALAVVHARSPSLDRPMATADDADDGGEPAADRDAPRASASRGAALGELLRALRATPALVGWSLAGTAVALLDEVLVAFAAVDLDARLHASATWRAAAIGAWTVGGVAGLLAVERALARAAPARILGVASAVATAALVAVACAPSPPLAAAALGAVGTSAATFHPLAKARAYAALPGRPALVNAAASLLLPLEALAPLALAAIASRAGSRAAVLALLAGPLGVGLAALADARRAARRPP